jgi:hypothetical protein
MISSQEFQRTLQAGNIHEALALLVRDAAEIDVTTRLTADNTSSEADRTGYLRTKINLLTGEIHNEVGKGVVIDSSSYLKLQKLHIEQVVVSDRMIQGYWNQLKTILGILSTNPIELTRSSSDSLAAKLAQATLLLQQEIIPVSPLPKIVPVQQAPSTPTISTQLSPISESIDDDLDLSIEAEGEVWEEWVEDEDFSSTSTLPQPSLIPPMLTIADRSKNSVKRHLNSLAVKPTAPRTNPESATYSPRWDKFAPDYIDTDSQPQITKNTEPHN